MLFGKMPGQVHGPTNTQPAVETKPSLASRLDDYIKERIVDEMLKVKEADPIEVPTETKMYEVANQVMDDYDFSDQIKSVLEDHDFGDMFSDLIEDVKSDIRSELDDQIREEVESLLSSASIQI